MTALAIFGSATSTSLTSRGRSRTTDLPTPSGTKREVASLAAIATTGTRGSLGAGPPATTGVTTPPNAPNRATKLTERISAWDGMCGAPFLFRRRGRGDAEANHIDAGATVVRLLGPVAAGV